MLLLAFLTRMSPLGCFGSKFFSIAWWLAMSNSPIFPTQNPYQPSTATYAPSTGYAAPKLPTFCLVMFILSLVFAGIRVPLVLMGVFAWAAIQPGPDEAAVYASVPFEVLSGAAIALFGIPGNIGMLMKRRWGAVLGILTVAASLFSMAVAVWQLTLMYPGSNNPAEQAGFIGGAAVTMVIRITLIGLYAMAVLKFQQWLSSVRPTT